MFQMDFSERPLEELRGDRHLLVNCLIIDQTVTMASKIIKRWLSKSTRRSCSIKIVMNSVLIPMDLKSLKLLFKILKWVWLTMLSTLQQSWWVACLRIRTRASQTAPRLTRRSHWFRTNKMSMSSNNIKIIAVRDLKLKFKRANQFKNSSRVALKFLESKDHDWTLQKRNFWSNWMIKKIRSLIW